MNLTGLTALIALLLINSLLAAARSLGQAATDRGLADAQLGTDRKGDV